MKTSAIISTYMTIEKKEKKRMLCERIIQTF